MTHRALGAEPTLSPVLRRVLTSTATEVGRVEVPVPPTGSIYLNALIEGRVQFDFGDGSRREAPMLYFGGQILRETLIATIQTPLLIVGLEFNATGFHRLFGVDASELTDRMTPLAAVSPATAQRVAEALVGLDRPESIAETLQSTLAERRPLESKRSLAERAAGAIEACGGRIDMTALATEFSVSERHLRRVFAREVGISPKAYAKTVQLNDVIAALHSGSEKAMRDIALSHGYFDQSHFVKDFSRLVGRNPTAFLASRDPFLEMFLGRKSVQ